MLDSAVKRSEERQSLHSQPQLQVLSISFGSIQRHGQRRLHIGSIHLTGEVDLQLVMIN